MAAAKDRLPSEIFGNRLAGSDRQAVEPQHRREGAPLRLASPAVFLRSDRSASPVVKNVIFLNLDRFLIFDVRFGRKGQIAQRADSVVVRSATTVRPLD